MPFAFLYLMLAHCPTLIVLTATLVTATMFHVPACELLGCHDLITGAAAAADILHSAAPVANDLLHVVAPAASDALLDIAPAINNATYSTTIVTDSMINDYIAFPDDTHTLYLQTCRMKYFWLDAIRLQRQGVDSRHARARLHALRGRRALLIERAYRD